MLATLTLKKIQINTICKLNIKRQKKTVKTIRKKSLYFLTKRKQHYSQVKTKMNMRFENKSRVGTRNETQPTPILPLFSPGGTQATLV
jgi:hypothetical protein